ncbi:MAG: tRNA pseudouridine(38-40) synthase TruA [Planctomycetota bacterium]
MESLSARTFKLTIEYDGTEFAGWQVQPGKETIQGSLQRAVQALVGEHANVIGSGRTDAGVHALGQVASCQFAWQDSTERLTMALNAHLPDAIVVTKVEEAVAGFHAIRDALGKRYRYQLQLGGRRDPFQSRYRWHIHHQLNAEAMAQAASHFLGCHDFRGFQSTGSERKTTIREIRACEVFSQSNMLSDRIHLAIEIEADGFLYNMVRTMVGTLVEVGRGKRPPDWIDELLATRERAQAGQTAPPQGLWLVRVDYPPTCLQNDG